MPFTRRQLLLSLTAGRGMLMCGNAASGGQSAQSPVSSGRSSSNTPLIPRSVLFAGADRSVVRLSPDGRRIAFLAPIDGVLNLWVADVREPTRARPLTKVTDRDLGPWIVWPHNNRSIVFFREQGGDENWQAHRVDLSTGDILALIPGPGVK